MLQSAVIALARRFDLPGEDRPLAVKVETRRRGLRIGNLNLLVPHDCGGELVDDVRIHTLPRTAAWCRGLINLRGRLVPAFDLHECLGLPHSRATKQWWLVLGRDDDCIAFALDALPVMLQASVTASVQPAVVPEALRAFVAGGFRVDGELWLEFRHREYFSALAQRVAA